MQRMTPVAFVSLDVSHRCVLQPGESLAVLLHNLKKLLGPAMPDLEAAACDQLLLHQFLAGLHTCLSQLTVEGSGRGQGPPKCFGESPRVDGHGQPRSSCSSVKHA